MDDSRYLQDRDDRPQAVRNSKQHDSAPDNLLFLLELVLPDRVVIDLADHEDEARNECSGHENQLANVNVVVFFVQNVLARKRHDDQEGSNGDVEDEHDEVHPLD